MSFDVFLQAFESGGVVDGDGTASLEVLGSFIAELDGSSARLVTGDGEADVFGIDRPSSGFMLNHASGDEVWQLVLESAVAAGFFVIPVGCPVAAVPGTDLAQLPPELGSAVVVDSGADLQRLIRSC